jgi:hypothetical protein
MNLSSATIRALRWVCCLLVVALISEVAELAADESRAAGAAPSDGSQLDSESLLIKRRELRLTLLPAPPTPPNVALPTSNPIDQFIAARWQQAGLSAGREAPPLCDDAAFVRRAYLDVTGVIPTMLQTNYFLVSRAADKREKLVDELLERREDYAAHWTPFWEDALASQSVLHQGGIPTHGNYRKWIFKSFANNRPYDVMVAELLDPTMPRRPSAVNEDIFGVAYVIQYVRNEDHTATLQTAANVGQVFLGTSMKCAGCHDHFENAEWTQERFLGFAGLFAPRDLERIRCDVKSGQFIASRFPFELPGIGGAVPNDLDARLHIAAQLLTDAANPRFAKTIVNRLWKRYMGLGLVEPVDDFRSDRPASHPELLDWLAYDFLQHGCDLKHTIRLILTSRTYQLAYDPKLADRFDASLADNPPRYFRSPALRRLSAEQLMDSFRLVTTGELKHEQRTYLDARSTALMRALGRPASRNEASTSRSDDVSVIAALELLNGSELNELVEFSNSFDPRIAQRDPQRATDFLYRTVLSRPATNEEKRHGGDFLKSAASLTEGIRDMQWVLLCSPEFQYVK